MVPQRLPQPAVDYALTWKQPYPVTTFGQLTF